MAVGARDDDTKPADRAGVDPLIANPLQSTGHTGEIPRPGDETPRWFIPSLFIVFAAFIAGLVYVSQIGERRADTAAPATMDTAPEPDPVEAGAAGTDSGESPTTDTGSDPVQSDPVQSDPGQSDPSQSDVLPPPGSVRVGSATYPIMAYCEVHFPLAPVDEQRQVSSYVFDDGSGVPRLIDRIVDGGDDTATSTAPGIDDSVGSIEEVGDTADIVVNPAAEGDADCDERLVTNEPGQFSEPHTWVVLDTCADTGAGDGDGFFVAGLTSEGGRFSARAIADGSAELRFRAPGGTGGEVLVDAAASVIADDSFSASGFVTDGDRELDLTIDLTAPADDRRSCTVSDRI